MDKKLTELAKNTSKIGTLVEGIAGVASIFFPKAAVPMIMASNVLKKVSEIDADTAEHNVFGITATAEALDDIITKTQSGEPVDIQKLKELSENLKVIDASLDKFYKIIS